MATVDLLLQFVDLQTCLITLIVFLLIYYLFFASSHELPPGPSSWPIVGNVMEMRKYGEGNEHLFYRDLQKKYGNVYKLSYGGHMMVVVNGYEAVNDILTKQGKFLNRCPAWLYGPSQILTVDRHKGILWSEGEEWRRLSDVTYRALCDQGVGHVTLEERIKEEMNNLIDTLSSEEGHELMVRRFIHNAVVNVISGIIFGSRFKYDDPTFLKLADTVEILIQTQWFLSTVNSLPLLRFLPSCRKKRKLYLEALETIGEYTQEQIEEHRKTLEENEERDYIDLLLHQKKQDPDCSLFTDKNITQCVVDLILAGTERVTSTLDFTLLYMIKYPDVQHKCQKEIDKFVGVGRSVEVDDCDSLLYTQATLMEVQRAACGGLFGTLRTCPRDTWIGGYRVPRGSLITPNLHSVLQDPDTWGDPHIFRPERYISPSRELVHPEALIPYGAGTRMCLGDTLARKELFLFFANLIQVFHFSKVENSNLELEPIMGVSANPKPYKLVLHTRC